MFQLSGDTGSPGLPHSELKKCKRNIPWPDSHCAPGKGHKLIKEMYGNITQNASRSGQKLVRHMEHDHKKMFPEINGLIS